MLRLSKKADYAIVALCHLRAIDKPATSREIATQYSLPPQLLANVLKVLSGAGILNSKRGATGGYFLGRAPKNITLGEIIEAIEGPMTFSVCSRDNHEYECIVTVECPAKNAMQVIHARINNYIQYLNLEELALLKPDDEKKTELGNENKCNCFSKDPNTETVQKTS